MTTITNYYLVDNFSIHFFKNMPGVKVSASQFKNSVSASEWVYPGQPQ